ncbi:PREDICTED: uncharacterized protein LOC104810904 isoform X2 [Tarenaya hassleriana]|uniref:uncharacterized protein LOC104810904 isoform X2 n=1 Tax=Tarenaya hassleriana TaxID=28532 RepID=UPI0008FCE917|nr:PREDICTED: uncharacterized protein LOC104810904 isoform X2 [Tarenaya hassleriana]
MRSCWIFHLSLWRRIVPLWSGAMLSGTEGLGKCHVQLGMCGKFCAERCVWSYLNGNGTCDSAGVCQCDYDPQLKSSRINMGFYTSGCTDEQCTVDCTGKLQQRAINIRGSCVSYTPWISCACLFDEIIC